VQHGSTSGKLEIGGAQLRCFIVSQIPCFGKGEINEIVLRTMKSASPIPTKSDFIHRTATVTNPQFDVRKRSELRF
jgi:hypothetical protein